MPVFVDVKSASGTTTTVVITKPVGLAVNDFMIAYIAVQDPFGIEGQPALASGWTLIDSGITLSAGSRGIRATVQSKVADAADVAASDFTFTKPGTANLLGGSIVAYRSVGPAGLDGFVLNSQITGPGDANVRFGSLVTTVPGTRIVFYGGWDHNASSGGNTVPPVALHTERLDDDERSVSHLIEERDALQVVPGATGTLVVPTSFTPTSVTVGRNFTFALAPVPPPPPTFESVASNSGSGLLALPIPKPAGLVVGELMVGIVSHHFFGQVTTVPAGWTKVGSDFIASAGNPRSTLAFKIADAGDVAASDFTFTRTGVAAGVIFIGAIVRISGIDASAPINVSLFNSTTPFGTSIATPSVVTTVDGALLIRAAVSFSELPNGPLPTATGPGTYIERLDIADIQVAAKEMGLHIYTIITNQPSAGATGTELITISDLNGGMNVNPGVTGLTIAIAPPLPVPPGGGPIGGPRSPFRILARRWRVLGTGA